jgi:hypothetical protein
MAIDNETILKLAKTLDEGYTYEFIPDDYHGYVWGCIFCSRAFKGRPHMDDCPVLLARKVIEELDND